MDEIISRLQGEGEERKGEGEIEEEGEGEEKKTKKKKEKKRRKLTKKNKAKLANMCDVWIVEQMRYRLTNYWQPTNQPTDTASY